MPDHADIACRLLRFEQQLKAYEKLHADELAELWRTLNECKQLIAALSQAADAPQSPIPTRMQHEIETTPH